MNKMNITQSKNRLLSLDVMRGLIMILLAGEACLLYVSLKNLQPNGTIGHLVDQTFSAPPLEWPAPMGPDTTGIYADGGFCFVHLLS